MSDLVIYYKNSSFFWTIIMPISAKLRDLGIEGLKDKIGILHDTKSSLHFLS